MTEFDKVFKLVKHELQCTDAEAVQASMLRQYHCDRERSVDELMRSEDVLDLLNKEDQKDVIKKRKDMVGLRERLKGFKEALKQKRSEIKRATRGQQGRGRGSSGSSTTPMPWGSRKWKKIPEGDLQQREVRGLMPPNTSIWCSRHAQAWCSHFPAGRQYISRSWSFGHRASALQVVAETWRAYLAWHSLDESECPLEDIMSLAG